MHLGVYHTNCRELSLLQHLEMVSTFGRDASKEGKYKEVGEGAQVKVIKIVNRGENLFL
jgi:hypothetical protein